MAETLQLVITGDNREALKAIQDTIKSTEGLKSQFQTLGSASNQANQALINSGRVLQDLNYGFVGIANNLNPLLESFQRLGDKATDTGTTIKKELLSALAGPAGIGVALSALTFIFLKFGDEIKTFFATLLSGHESFSLFNKELELTKDSYSNAYVTVEKLKVSFNEFHAGVKTKKEVLAEYNSTFGKVLGTTNDINTAEQTFINNTDKYINAILQRAVADQAMTDAGKLMYEKRKVEQKDLSEFMPSAQAGAGFIDQYERIRIAKELKQKELDKIQSEIDKLTNLSKTSNEEYDKLIKEMLGGKRKTDATKPDKLRDTSEDYWKDLEKYIREQNDVIKPKKGMNTIDYELPQGVEDYKQKVDKVPLLYKTIIELRKKDDDSLKAQQEAYKQFANFMSSQVTNAISSVFDAMKNGTNVVEALGSAFLKLAENIAMAIIQEEIYQSISSALNIGADVATGGAASGGSSIMKIISSLFSGPHATGGITTGPSLGLIGEAGPEAIVPLSKMGSMLKSTFNAGAMSGGSAGGGGQFVLRGQDLLVAINRTQKASSLKGQNISLA